MCIASKKGTRSLWLGQGYHFSRSTTWRKTTLKYKEFRINAWVMKKTINGRAWWLTWKASSGRCRMSFAAFPSQVLDCLAPYLSLPVYTTWQSGTLRVILGVHILPARMKKYLYLSLASFYLIAGLMALRMHLVGLNFSKWCQLLVNMHRHRVKFFWSIVISQRQSAFCCATGISRSFKEAIWNRTRIQIS